MRLFGIYVFSYLSNCQAVPHFHEIKVPFLLSKANTTCIKKNRNVIRDRSEKGVKCVNGICYMSRGGSIGEEYDDDDEEEEEEEENIPLRPPSRSRQQSQSRRRPPSRSRQQSQSRRRPTVTRRGPPPAGRVPPPARRRPAPRRRHSPSVLSSVAGLAKKTVDLTTSATVSTL